MKKISFLSFLFLFLPLVFSWENNSIPPGFFILNLFTLAVIPAAYYAVYKKQFNPIHEVKK